MAMADFEWTNCMLFTLWGVTWLCDILQYVTPEVQKSGNFRNYETLEY